MGWVERDGTVRCIIINEMNELLELAALNNHPSASPLPCMYYGPCNVRMAGWEAALGITGPCRQLLYGPGC